MAAVGAAGRDAAGILHSLVADAARPGRLAIDIVAAHPDDEIIGAGSLLLRPYDWRIIHVTDGAPRDLADARRAGFSNAAAYARRRRLELAAALRLAGIQPGRCCCLNVADQAATADMAEIAAALAGLWANRPPDAVVTHAYEGGHPDHDAAAFAVHAACALLRRGGRRPPVVLEMAGYNAPGGAVQVLQFLPATAAAVVTVRLPPVAREIKRRMLDCFVSQHETLRPFPVTVERFRPAPLYDFRRPPHAGPLNYDRQSWGATSAGWRDAAGAALAALGMADLPCL